MADSDTTQQVTSQTPATKQKNPKRVAAGRAIAARKLLERNAHKKAFIEAMLLIKAKHVDFSDDKHPSRDPLTGQDEVDNAKQSSAITEHYSAIAH